MDCMCSGYSFIKGNDATLYGQKYLRELKVDGINWKTLYQCKFCEVYWEEKNEDDRYIGSPILEKVTISYVKSNW